MTGGQLTIRILGCGSSGGVPRVGNQWGACDPANPKNLRSRCSILLRRSQTAGGEETIVLIDTSPDLRTQLLAARMSRLDAVLITHQHADQCHGIDDLRPIAIMQRATVPVHMDEVTGAILTSRFDYCFKNKTGYPAILEPLIDLAPGRVVTIDGSGGAMDFLCLDQDHGTCRSLGFRIDAFAYVNDVVRLPEETLAQLEGLDLLVVDALRYTPHPTHANVDQALDWIARLKPRRAVLTNMHVDLDYEELRRRLPEQVEPAFDGMELSLDLPA